MGRSMGACSAKWLARKRGLLKFLTFVPLQLGHHAGLGWLIYVRLC
jgi:hypothetical protein